MRRHRDGRLTRGLAFSLGLLASVAAAQPPATVALDLGGLDEASYARLDGLGLEKRVVLRLVQDGFAVVAATADADVRIGVSPSASGVTLLARGSGQQASREVSFGEEPLAELHLELAQKAVELARLCAPPPPVLAPPPGPPPGPKASARPDIDLTLGAAAVAQVRSGGTDLSARLSARVGHQLGLTGTAGLVPSAAPGLSILELQLAGGPSVRFALAHRFELDVALCAGLLLHTFRFDDGRTGTPVAVVASLPVNITFWPVPWFGVGLRAAAGLSSRTEEHREANQVLWGRGPAFFDAGVAVFNRF